MLLSFAAAILAIVSLFSPNFGKNVQFTLAGEIKVSHSWGCGLSEEASSIRRNSITAISAVSLETISIFFILCLGVKGGCLRWLSRSYRRWSTEKSFHWRSATWIEIQGYSERKRARQRGRWIAPPLPPIPFSPRRSKSVFACSFLTSPEYLIMAFPCLRATQDGVEGEVKKNWLHSLWKAASLELLHCFLHLNSTRLSPVCFGTNTFWSSKFSFLFRF